MNVTNSTTGTGIHGLPSIINLYFMKIGVPIVCVIGLTANTFNFLLFAYSHNTILRRTMEKSANLELLSLSGSNMMFCLMASLITLVSFDENDHGLHVALFYTSIPNVITYFIVTSTWITVIMSGERYLAVVHPLTAKTFITMKRTKISIILILIICLMASVPLYFDQSIVAVNMTANTTIWEIRSNDMFIIDGVPIRRIIWAILFDFIPCVALLYFNVNVILRIVIANTQRQRILATTVTVELSEMVEREDFNSEEFYPQRKVTSQTHNKLKKQKRKNRINKTFISVAIVFLILVSPSEFIKLITTIGEGKNSRNFYIVRSVTNFMQATNFSLTFLAYIPVQRNLISKIIKHTRRKYGN